ncbi:hypothetical protein HWV62_29328 [Athelia sp. TMB]|nr:hypothetical protein HWV62_29328 [Athelia sp. TMB]
MKTRNIKQRRPVVVAVPKPERSTSAIGAVALGDNPVSQTTVGKKRNRGKALTPETEGPDSKTLLQSPSKSRVKPSERSVTEQSGFDDDRHVSEVAANHGASNKDVMFTDDEDFVSVSVGQAAEDDEDDVEDARMPELIDVSASESEGGGLSDGDEQDDAEGYEIVRPSAPAAPSRDARNEIPVGRKKRTMVEETLDKMEIEREMYVEARKKSIASIASTNPGDGTKRLHGEESYIHDDIQGLPVGPRGRPRIIAPVTPTKSRQKKAARVYYDVDDNMAVTTDNADDMVLLSDSAPRGEEGPAECEVANADDMDEIIDYADLPPLSGNKRLISWSQLVGPGLAVPSAWHEENPAISMSQFRTCIQFRNSDWFYNPSRMTPSDMGLSPFPGNSYICIGGTTRTATMTTAILVTSSNIHRMKEVFGEDRRMIAGIPHITEFQRMEAGLLMALRLETAHAQMSQQAITFSTTRTMGNGGSSPTKNPSKMFRQPAGASASRGSPFASAVSNIQGAGYARLTLAVVPVLDARHCRFSMKNLVGLDKVLPTFNAEVPEGSLAWVGYTVNKYTTTRGSHINFNLLWVVVLGTPE